MSVKHVSDSLQLQLQLKVHAIFSNFKEIMISDVHIHNNKYINLKKNGTQSLQKTGSSGI